MTKCSICGSKIAELFLEKSEVELFVNEALRDSKKIIKEMTLSTKDKKTIPVSVCGLSRRDDEGNFIGYFLAISDITEVKKFQGELEDRVRAKTKDLEESKRALVNILEDVDEARIRAEDEKNKTLAVITNFTDGLLIFDKKGNLVLINPRAESLLGIEAEKLINNSAVRIKNMPVFEPLAELIGKRTNLL